MGLELCRSPWLAKIDSELEISLPVLSQNRFWGTPEIDSEAVPRRPWGTLEVGSAEADLVFRVLMERPSGFRIAI